MYIEERDLINKSKIYKIKMYFFKTQILISFLKYNKKMK